MHRRNGAEHGFTLLEIMAVVMILGILVLIAMATYGHSVGRSREMACAANRRIIQEAFIAYQQEHHDPPAGISDLAPYVKGRDAGFDTCPSDDNVHYTLDTTTGRVTCPIHGSD